MNTKLIVAWALLPYTLWLAFEYDYHFIDGANLLIHEAGHLLFNFFGNNFLTVAGGTILQLSLPIIFSLHLYFRHEKYDAAVCSLWFGESLMYTAVYLGDARAQKLPLWGGGSHDWTFLLSRFNLLGYCGEIASILHAVAVLVVLASLFQMFKFATPPIQPALKTAEQIYQEEHEYDL